MQRPKENSILLRVLVCAAVLLSGAVVGAEVGAREEVTGRIKLLVGEAKLVRDGAYTSAAIGALLFPGDSLEVSAGARCSVTLADGSVVNVPAGTRVAVADMVRESLQAKSGGAWKALTRLLRKKGDTGMMVACMGTRGIMDENGVEKSLPVVEELLSRETDPATRLELLSVKASLLAGSGDFGRAMSILGLLEREADRGSAEGVVGAAERLSEARTTAALLEASRISVSVPPLSGDPETAARVAEYLRRELAISGMLAVVDGDALYSIEGGVSLSSNTATLTVGLTSDTSTGAGLVGEPRSWTIDGAVGQIEYLAAQMASNIHQTITGFDIPRQNLLDDFAETAGFEPMPGVVLSLGLDKPGISPEYRNGETVTISFVVNTIESGAGRESGDRHSGDLYMNLFAVGPEGEINLLFPNDFERDNRIDAGVVYSVPRKGAEYALEVYGISGKNAVIGIVTGEPFSPADSERIRAEVFPLLGSIADAYLHRGLRVKAFSAGVNSWTVGKIHFLVRE